MSAGGRSSLLRFVFRYGAPAILCTVALIQMVLVYRFDLTPWKGGGFGMFSTVDSLEARYVKIFLVMGERSIPAIPPPSLSADYLRVQALPTQVGIDALAVRLAQSSWIDTATGQNRFRPQPGRIPQDGPVFAPPGGGPMPGRLVPGGLAPGNPAAGPQFLPPQPGTLPGPEVRNVRALETSEPLPPGADVLRFDSLRLEVWRYNYTAASSEVIASRIAAAAKTAPSPKNLNTEH